MKQLIITVSTLILLTHSTFAQLRPVSVKRIYGKLTARRNPPARSPIPTSLKAKSISTNNIALAGGVVNLEKGQVQPSAGTQQVPLPRVLASLAPRSSPELYVLPQQVIRSYYVDLAYNKTVSIIFPAPVRSVDLGSRSIIADKAANVENVLKVKAGQIGFNETNFAVMTADGKFYSFVVNYNETPTVLALNLAGTTGPDERPQSDQVNLSNRTQLVNEGDEGEGHIQFAGVRATQSDIVYTCDRILRYRGRGRLGSGTNKMNARLRGLFVEDNVLYYRLTIENESNLAYDIDYIRFFVVDAKTARLTSRQEVELRPIYVYNDAITTVKGRRKAERVYAFQRFTMPNNKQLHIVIGEQGGGRVPSFDVRNKDIMKARPL